MNEQQKRWLKRVGWGFVLFICVLPCAACAVTRLPIVRQYQANRLDDVVGEVEMVFSAGNRLSPFLSPDGKWFFVVKPTRPDGSREAGMMDTETYHIYSLDIPIGGTYWIDNHHLQTGTTIIRVPDMISWQVEYRYTTSDPNALNVLVGAGQVLAMEGRTAKGYYDVIAPKPDRPYIVYVKADNREKLAAQLANIQYIIVPASEWDPLRDRSNTRLYSPDGKYFVSGGEYSPEEDTYHPQRPDQWKSMKHPSSIIFDAQTEKMVAMARKEGWGTTVLGWASDSSGVYLQFLPLGGDTGGFPAGAPTYKLLVPGQHPSGKTPTFVEGTPPSKP